MRHSTIIFAKVIDLMWWKESKMLAGDIVLEMVKEFSYLTLNYRKKHLQFLLKLFDKCSLSSV
jgi:hypothetical protein